MFICRKISKILTDKILSFLQSEMKKDPIKYSEFYKNFSLYIKEGVITDVEQSSRVRVFFYFKNDSLKVSCGKENTGIG